MDNIVMEFVHILRNNPDEAYNFFANNYHKFSKYEMVDIIKELLYGIYHEVEYGMIIKADHDHILSTTADELEDIYKGEEA